MRQFFYWRIKFTMNKYFSKSFWYLCVLVSATKGTLTTEGSKFILYFSEGSQARFPLTPLSIYVTTRSLTPVTVNVSTPVWMHPDSGNVSIQVTSEFPKSVSVPASVRLSQVGLEGKGVLVESSGPVSVFALNPSKNQAGLCAVLPTSSLGTEYIFPSFIKFNIDSQGFMGFVTEHEQTKVEVFLPASNHSSMAILSGIPYKAGAKITGQLNSFYVLEIRQDPNCSTCDLSGSRIKANKPIAVFSVISLSGLLSNKDGGDLLVEQLVPLSLWGRTYVTMTTPDNVQGTFVRVMAGEPNVTVYKSSMDSFVLEQPGQYEDIVVKSGRHLMFQGDKKLQVIQCSSISPFMLLVTPLEHYGRSAHVPTIVTDTTSENKIVIFARVCDADHITVNGSLLSNKHWQEVGLTGFVMTEITVTQPGFHRIESEADYQASFGGYVYGEGATDVAYAAPLTMEGNKTVENFPWAEPMPVDIHKANQANKDGVTQHLWKLVEKDVMPSSTALVVLSVTSSLPCFNQCQKIKSCKYVSIINDKRGKQTCWLFNDKMTCPEKVRHPGVRTYTSRLGYSVQAKNYPQTKSSKTMQKLQQPQTYPYT